MTKINKKKILITGASFIGIHLIKKLLKEQVASITVVNLSNKHIDSLRPYLKDIAFYALDLRNIESAKKIIKNHDIVVHLAADHGGRGYVDLKQGNTASNFLLDGSVFKACLDTGIEKVFFASSGCVYPNFAQVNTSKKIYLQESIVKQPYDADNIYGWAKLMGELTLKKYHEEFGLKSAIGRFFTVYGSHASESHAVIGSIAKAFVKQNPFEIWGDGKQIRNWTYVEDIVEGIIQSIKHIDDATPVNFGTQERIKVDKMVSLVLHNFHYSPKIRYVSMPTGPMNRVADISLAKTLLNWSPKYTFKQGLQQTIQWYIENKNKKYIQQHLKKLLIHD